MIVMVHARSSLLSSTTHVGVGGNNLPSLPAEGRDKLTFEFVATLSGGSLGSCVDEERSQLRELM